MVDGREAGRIVYDSKNASTRQNAFVTKARQYKTRYDTPHVIIVTRALPRKERALCVRSAVPLVEPSLVIPLAATIRAAIAEIGQLRSSSAGREQKARVLYDYILSDAFRTRFSEIAASLTALRDQQEKDATGMRTPGSNGRSCAIRSTVGDVRCKRASASFHAATPINSGSQAGCGDVLHVRRRPSRRPADTWFWERASA